MTPRAMRGNAFTMMSPVCVSRGRGEPRIKYWGGLPDGGPEAREPIGRPDWAQPGSPTRGASIAAARYCVSFSQRW